MTVKIEGMAAIVKKLESLNKPEVFNKPMRQSVDHLYKIMTSNPRKAPGAFSRLATDAQRRAYWAKVSENPSIHGPQGYNRSGRLQRDWSRRVTKQGREGIVENANTGGYAQYVQGIRQQPFHAVTKYNKTDEVAKKEAPKVIAFFKAAYDKAVK